MAEPLPRNVRLFCWFCVFFNARFYYPVLAVFFVDLGLTLDEFAILNVAWAASIVLFELPLGALADRIGRRPLVVGAAGIMVLEMAVLAFAPADNPRVLFWVFFANRVLSGLAEAAASGADEALAYDTLLAEGRRDQWPRVLSRLQRWMAVAFTVSMIIGAKVYDSTQVNDVLAALGFDARVDASTSARFPVYLTLGLAFCALAVSLRMTEPKLERVAKSSIRDGVRRTLAIGRWICATPFASAVILFALLVDSPGRIVFTLASSVYRMNGVPERYFGELAALLGAVGFIAPSIAMRLMRTCSPWLIYAVIAITTLAAVYGLATPSIGLMIFCMAALGIAFNLLGFFTSHYLNMIASSESRATVLSFRSLAGSLSYGVFGALYAVAFRSAARVAPTDDDALARTLEWIPVTFFWLLLPVFIGARTVRNMRICETIR